MSRLNTNSKPPRDLTGSSSRQQVPKIVTSNGDRPRSAAYGRHRDPHHENWPIPPTFRGKTCSCSGSENKLAERTKNRNRRAPAKTFLSQEPGKLDTLHSLHSDSPMRPTQGAPLYPMDVLAQPGRFPPYLVVLRSDEKRATTPQRQTVAQMPSRLTPSQGLADDRSPPLLTGGPQGDCPVGRTRPFRFCHRRQFLHAGLETKKKSRRKPRDRALALGQLP